MTRPHRIASLLILAYSAVLSVFARGENVDSYCGKSFAQNGCSLRCASGTDQECIDILGKEYKCFTMTGCSERQNNREAIHTSSRRTAGQGVCSSTLEGAVMGCDIREPCSGDLDCAGAKGEVCYSNVGCGNQLVELHSEFKITMIGVVKPMDEAAESTLTQTLSTFLEPILAESKIALDSVGIIGDSQHSGVMLDVRVKFSGLYRPSVEQNLGGIIIGAFSCGTQTYSSSSVVMQNAFISSLSSHDSYYSGVVSILSTLEENGSRSLPSPTTPAPTVQIENSPSTKTEEFADPLAGKLLTSDTAKEQEQDEKDAAKVAAKEQANAVADPAVKSDQGGLGLGALIGIVAALLISSMVVLGVIYRQYEMRRSLIVEQGRKMFEGDEESDFESDKSDSEGNIRRDIESGEESTPSSSDSLEGPRGPGSRRSSMANSFSTDISLESALREMAGSNQMQSRPRNGDDERSTSSDSDSSGSGDSQHSGTTTSHQRGSTSDSDDSGSSSDDSSSDDESDDSSRKAAATTAVRKSAKRRLSTDEEMTEEIKACWNDLSLTQQERVTKISEIKARRFSTKKLQEEANSESFQQSLKQSRGGKQSKGKNRRITVDGSGVGNPRPGKSTRRLSEVSSGRNSLIRRKAMIRTMSAESFGSSDDVLNRSFNSNSLRRSSVGAERRNSFTTSLPDLANSDQYLDRKRLSSSVGAETETNRYGGRRNSFTRRNDPPDLANSEQYLERKKFSSMKAWQRPQSRRLSL